MRSFVAVAGCAALLIGCAGGVASSPQAPPAHAARPASSGGNIYWGKGKLKLQYPPHGKKEDVLHFWGPDGYFTEALYCEHGSQVAITHGKIKGDPSGYQYVTYTFHAKSAGPDSCSFDAVLNNTGSPPIAVLRLVIGS
ncbi:MAG TPA: hypothetical protein VHS56_09910 [Candidatus Cybelea sp.]|nr:hypothetical protein [Candidatus Cybelea sp.]